MSRLLIALAVLALLAIPALARFPTGSVYHASNPPVTSARQAMTPLGNMLNATSLGTREAISPKGSFVNEN